MLLGGYQDPEEALRRANGFQISDWHRLTYTCSSRVMLFRGFGSPHQNLVLAGPTYMRLPNHFPGAEFSLATPEEARSILRIPESVEVGGRLVVRVRSMGTDFCVVCREVGHFTDGQAGLVRRRFSPRVRLRGADLREQSLCYEPLERSDLRQVQFCRADLTYANLERCDLRGANLDQACLRRTRLVSARLQRASFRGANLHDTEFYEADLRHADLEHTDLRGAGLNNANLSHARAAGVNLQEDTLRFVRFRNADLRGANLRGATVCADLRGADLRGADLRGADLRESGLGGARLDGSRTDGLTRWPGDPPSPKTDPDPDLSTRERLARLDGATLSWRWTVVSLGLFNLSARLPDDRHYRVSFGSTTVVDLPKTCTDATIRTASLGQRDAYCARLPADFSRLSPEAVFAVRCDEGEFMIICMSMTCPNVEPVERSHRSDLDYCHQPLWPGGPGLPEWWTGER